MKAIVARIPLTLYTPNISDVEFLQKSKKTTLTQFMGNLDKIDFNYVYRVYTEIDGMYTRIDNEVTE